jgi:hypothetical protein
MNPSLSANIHRKFSTEHAAISPRCPTGIRTREHETRLGSTDLRSKSGRMKCGPERERGVRAGPPARTIPLSVMTGCPLDEALQQR